MKQAIVGLLALCLQLGLATRSSAQNPPAPTPDPGGAPNVFYGAVPPNGQLAPLIFFIHGLNGNAYDWWGGPGSNANDMYALAYQAGFRTAFVSMNADNSRSSNSTQVNAATLSVVMPTIAARDNISSYFVVAHSMGNLDLQLAMMNPNIAKLVRSVFAISCPCIGTALANWAVGPGSAIAASLNLLTPGVLSLQTGVVGPLRTQFDSVFENLGVTFFTIEGSTFTGNILTDATGLILAGLTPANGYPTGTGGLPNDGFVTETSAQLPSSYAVDLGTVSADHFDTNKGDVSWPKIYGELQGFQTSVTDFKKIANDGFGDPNNTWTWGMKWFNGKLYVGTGRNILCLTLLTSDMQEASGGLKLYPGAVSTGNCPSQPTLWQTLQAEIWQYTPETQTWVRVFQSPNCIPLPLTANGIPFIPSSTTPNPPVTPPPFNEASCSAGTSSPSSSTVGYTARDVGFRGMVVFTEADGTQALYAGGVTSGSVYDGTPPYNTNYWPPPRLLRSVDGVHWTAVPQDAGTFMANLTKPLPGSTRKEFSFRGLTQFGNKMFASVADFPGDGYLIVSTNPSAGDNAWEQASPIPEQMPIWYEVVFNNSQCGGTGQPNCYLYATTGDHALPNNPGYQVFKTDASGSPPYTWTPVVGNAGCMTDIRYQAPNGLSMAVFNNQLYVGTNRPTEMVRINPDDSWDLVVGQPRQVGPACNSAPGLKVPVTGMGSGFADIFTGHMWRMNASSDTLYLGTWNWSVGIKFIPQLDEAFENQFGFDLYRTHDGVHWESVTRSGFNDQNYGCRSIESTPIGFFIGSATPYGGLQIYQEVGYLQNAGNTTVSNQDVANLLTKLNTPDTSSSDPMDLTGDGNVDILSGRILATQCTNAGCGGGVQVTVTPPTPTTPSQTQVVTAPSPVNPSGTPTVQKFPSPTNLAAANDIVSPGVVSLTWSPVQGAVSYTITRIENQPVLSFIPPNTEISLPGVAGQVAVPEDLLNGSLDYLCDPNSGLVASIECTILGVIQDLNNSANEDISFPMPAAVIASTSGTSYQETAPTPYQSIYYVQALSASGQLSDPSNIVAAPAKAAP